MTLEVVIQQIERQIEISWGMASLNLIPNQYSLGEIKAYNYVLELLEDLAITVVQNGKDMEL